MFEYLFISYIIYKNIIISILNKVRRTENLIILERSERIYIFEVEISISSFQPIGSPKNRYIQ
nr:MAG TPA: hypothetical protein [Caudoviricetes sp.]